MEVERPRCYGECELYDHIHAQESQPDKRFWVLY